MTLAPQSQLPIRSVRGKFKSDTPADIDEGWKLHMRRIMLWVIVTALLSGTSFLHAQNTPAKRIASPLLQV